MRARIAAALAVAAVTVLTTAAPALAATTAQVTSPGTSAVVDRPTPVRVQVRREIIDTPPSTVSVRLSRDGSTTAPGTEPAPLDCVDGCRTLESTWGGVDLQPTGAPFVTAGPVCNGQWTLQPRVDGGEFTAGTPVVLSAPGSPVAGFDARGAAGAADLSWSRAPEPDVAGYRVERREGRGTWESVTTLGPSATRYRDEVAAGEYTYRVVTLRPDGVRHGQAAAPCVDRDADLETVSASRSASVTPAPSPTATTTADAGTDGGATAGGTTSDGTSADGAGTAGDGDDQTGEPQDAPSAGRRVAAPPPAQRSSSSDAAPPRLEVEQRGSDGPAYYGEDQEFSEEIDYGDAPRVAGAQAPTSTGEPSATDDEYAAGAVDIASAQSLELGRILKPVAVGLLLTTVGLHLRRWMREPDVD